MKKSKKISPCRRYQILDGLGHTYLWVSLFTLAVVATYYLHGMFWIQNRINGPGPLGNAFVNEFTLIRFSFLYFTHVGHLLRNFGTFVKFGFSLYCLFIADISANIAYIFIILLMALTTLKKGNFRERKVSRFRDFFRNSRNLKTLEVSIREILFSRNLINSSIREIKLSQNRLFLVIFPDFRNWLHQKLWQEVGICFGK